MPDRRVTGHKMKSKPPRCFAPAVKICGITCAADARLAVESGADALGFNFYRKSPRNIAVSRARQIISRLPRDVTAVGIFVNASSTNVLKIARRARLAALQLHGDESPASVARLSEHFSVIKALQVGPSFSMRQLEKYSAATAFLLDGFDHRFRGGTGRIFNWKALKSGRRGKRQAPLILAGGLNKKNVRSAIRAVEPCAVDVCSGVERSPGRKDAKKMRGFFGALAAPGRKTK